MSEIDPILFGKMCGNVETTLNLVQDMDKKLDTHTVQITALESRNEYVKEGWKKAGIFSGVIASLCGMFAAVWGMMK